MKKLHLTHKIFTASVVGAVTVTTSVAAVFAYQAVTQYKPTSSKEDMKNNQVLFNNNKNSLGNGNKNEQNSKWLEKQDQKNKQDATQNSNYLFDKKQDVAVQKTMTVNTQTTTSTDENTSQNTKDDDSNTVTGSDTNTVVDVDKNAKNPDIIIDDNSGTSGKDNTGKEDNSNSGTIDPALPDSNHKPAPTPNPGDNPNPGGNNSNNKYDKVKDPVSTKSDVNKNFFSYSEVEIKDYSADKVEESKKDKDSNVKILIQPVNDFEFQLYQGQTITKTSLFNMMVTGVFVTDSNGDSSFYSWNDNELGKYIKINGISIDGGITWIDDFPYTIPNGVTNIRIDLSYRLSEKDTWTHHEEENDYLNSMTVNETKVMVLKKKIDDKTTEIDTDDIVNSTQLYPSVGDTLDLLDMQFYIFNEDIKNDKNELKYLFAGWTENGQSLDWLYTVTSGRHFIEPMDLIPLDSQYVAKLLYTDVTIDGKNYFDGLQALTGTTEEGNLTVPKYIQMIDFENEQSFDSVKLPDTVMAVHDKNLSVGEWKVSENNPYLVVKDGLLMSKDLTEIISIPESINEVEVSNNIDKISAQNLSGKIIFLKTSDMDKLPEIDFSNLKGCKFVLSDSLFDQYLSDNYSSIVKGENITFAKASNLDVEYTVKNHCVVCGNTLYKAIEGVSTISLEDNIDTIAKNAFKNVKGIRNLILNDSLITFEEGCFDDSSLKHIYCYTDEQLEYVQKRMKELGYDDIEVSLNVVVKDGFRYKVENDGTNTLLKAPNDVTEFNGVVGDIQFDAIGDGAFKDCTSLKKVYLPESVIEIGEEAFENCSSLELMIIDARDNIDIGKNAFEGLSSIRMLASNARYANMNGYRPSVSEDNFFIPTYNSGYDYGSYFLGSFGPYTFESIGKNTEAIYLNTWEGTPFLLLSTPACVDSQVTLLDTTSQIYSWSMANTYSEGGEGYTINLGALNDIYYNSYAFYNSNISGEVTIGAGSYIEENSFDSCLYIKSLNILDDIIVQSAAFYGCDSIEKVKMKNVNELYTGAFMASFYGLGTSLSEIEFEGNIPDLIVSETGWQFNFTGWFDDQIHITLTNTPYTNEEFLQKYMYIFAGYIDSDDETASQAMWNEVIQVIIWEHMWDEEQPYIPTYDEIYEQFKTNLLQAENNLRKMLGMDQVTEPTWMPTDIPTKEEYEGKTEDEEKKDEEGSEEKDPSSEEPSESEESKNDPDQTEDSTKTDIPNDLKDGDSEIEEPSDSNIDEIENGVEQPVNESFDNNDLNDASVQTEDIQLLDGEDFQ